MCMAHGDKVIFKMVDRLNGGATCTKFSLRGFYRTSLLNCSILNIATGYFIGSIDMDRHINWKNLCMIRTRTDLMFENKYNSKPYKLCNSSISVPLLRYYVLLSTK